MKSPSDSVWPYLNTFSWNSKNKSKSPADHGQNELRGALTKVGIRYILLPIMRNHLKSTSYFHKMDILLDLPFSPRFEER